MGKANIFFLVIGSFDHKGNVHGTEGVLTPAGPSSVVLSPVFPPGNITVLL